MAVGGEGEVVVSVPGVNVVAPGAPGGAPVLPRPPPVQLPGAPPVSELGMRVVRYSGSMGTVGILSGVVVEPLALVPV